jgi:hypothetical protein
VLSVILAAAVAATSPVVAPASAKPVAQGADALVCHTEAGESSRIPRRVCMRASEIAQRQLDARWQLDRAQNMSPTPNMASMVSMGPRR